MENLQNKRFANKTNMTHLLALFAVGMLSSFAAIYGKERAIEIRTEQRYERETSRRISKALSNIGVDVKPIKSYNPQTWPFEMLMFRIDENNAAKLVENNHMVLIKRGSETYDFYFNEEAPHIQSLGALFRRMKTHPDCRLYEAKLMRGRDIDVGEVFFYSPATREGLVIVFHTLG